MIAFDSVVIVLLMIYAIAAVYCMYHAIKFFSGEICVWWSAGVRRKRIYRLQQNWLNFRFCRQCSFHGAEYWNEFVFDYERIRDLAGKYLCTGV